MKKVIVSAAAVAALIGLATPAMADGGKHAEKEKCYGVVKAGKNMCGSADGKHGCQGSAMVDGGKNEWVYTPKGLCAKLVGGSTTPGK